ncbi:MAG: hypothetical protein ACK4P2_02360 [Hyphomonas sp.]
MILRRITEHVKAQNWFAVALDFLIVVLGVFVATQVANWNAARGERAAEAGYLSALEGDITFSIASLETLVVQLETQEAARQRLFAYASDPAAEIAPEELDLLVKQGIFHLPSINISQITFDTLKSSGRLTVLRSPELVAALQELEAQVAAALVTQADELQVTYLFTDPMLVENFDMLGVFQQPGLGGAKSIAWLPDQRAISDVPEIAKSQRFRNAVLYRSYFAQSRIASLNAILAEHKKIAGLIDARQARLGAAP